MAVFSVYSPRPVRRSRRTTRLHRRLPDRVSLLQVEELRGVTVVRLSGEVDAYTASSLATSVARTCAAATGGVVLDLRSVDFLGVAGVMALSRVAAWADETGLPLRLVACSPPVLRALRVTGFAHQLVACGSLDEAVTECSEVRTRPGSARLIGTRCSRK